MYIEERRRKKGGSGILKLIFFVIFIGVIAGGTYFYFKTPSKIEKANKTEVLSATTTVSPKSKEVALPSSLGLKTAVDEALKGTHGTYGIVIKNLKTGEYFAQNEHRVFEPASVYKLWIMGAVYQGIEEGKIKDDEVLSKDVEYLNMKYGIPSDIAEQTEGTVTFSIRDALIQMIDVSDNYAALLLTDRVGLSAVSRFLETNGFFETKVGAGNSDPTTTPSDIALFLEKLDGGQLANEKSTKEMLDLLRWQRLNDLIPKYLPDGVVVAHKTGALEPFAHDAGIVYSEFGNYVIVVMTETDSRFQAEERVALVSKKVYEYFSAGKKSGSF